MFVLETYQKNHKAKIAAWERARSEYVAKDTYGTYSSYSDKYPRPGSNWRIVGTVLPVALIVLFVVGGAVFILKHAPKPDPNNPNNCSVVVKKGDKVGVKGGNFAGSKGEVIEQRDSCEVNLTLTSSTWNMARCLQVEDRGWCDKAKENGEILSVDNSKDIIKL